MENNEYRVSILEKLIIKTKTGEIPWVKVSRTTYRWDRVDNSGNEVEVVLQEIIDHLKTDSALAAALIAATNAKRINYILRIDSGNQENVTYLEYEELPDERSKVLLKRLFEIVRDYEEKRSLDYLNNLLDF